ncbi:MAG: hypothetical protein ACRCVU_11775 [Flavobacterium sp.]
MKSEGVRDIVKWMQEKIKEQKLNVQQAVKDVSHLGHFEDCGDYYHSKLNKEQAILVMMVSWKASTEKYMKKLQHNGE